MYKRLFLFVALFAPPAMADEQVVPTPAAPTEPLFEPSRPAQVVPKDKSGSREGITKADRDPRRGGQDIHQKEGVNR